MKIAFIVPYFGKWPIWFPAFLKSCESNPTIQWIFFTDCDIPINKPSNVDFHETNLEAIQILASSKMGFEVALNSPKKLCDLKPAYGDLFSEYLTEYEFWGFCDIDIIWGDIKKYITKELLDNFDIITTLDKMISGHFTLFRNNPQSHLWYQHSGVYKECFQKDKHIKFDEIYFSQIITELTESNQLKVFWDKEKIKNGIESAAHQEYLLDNWIWKEGRIFQIKKDVVIKEYMYLHFINWKNNIKSCEVNFTETVNTFYISHNSIHLKPHSDFEIKWNGFKNMFNGFYAKLWRKRKIKKLRKFKKKIKKYFKLTN